MATMTLDELVSQLGKAYGNDLRAVVLYGSAASGDYVPKRSDQNVLVIVEKLPLDRLHAAAAVTRAWREGGNPAPMTLTLSEWRGSADIFPMEYADILDRHKVLFGDPPFAGVKVDQRHLRLQLEYEAMGKLLHLRQGVLSAGGDAARQLALLEASLSTIMVIFRGALRLHGVTPPADREAVCRETAARGGFDAEPFRRVVRHVRGDQALAKTDAPGVLSGYLGGMERLVAYLDQLEVV